MQATTIPPATNPITAPPGPAAANQPPTRTHQAEPMMDPKPNANSWKRPISPLRAGIADAISRPSLRQAEGNQFGRESRAANRQHDILAPAQHIGHRTADL